jgi:hypothetical protein
MKYKNHMIISIGIEKKSDRNQYSFIIKNFQLKIRRLNELQNNKIHISQTQVTSHSTVKRRTFSL